ncbi:MAG: HNH endonuclease [Caldilineaceae bacterium]|nr:HNH endonuclease [Caldilineaceae bacterium]
MNNIKYLPYADYLQSTHWRRTRRKKIASVGSRCEQCGRRKALQVHHLTYERKGEELMTDLQVLCRACHKAVHRI